MGIIRSTFSQKTYNFRATKNPPSRSYPWKDMQNIDWDDRAEFYGITDAERISFDIGYDHDIKSIFEDDGFWNFVACQKNLKSIFIPADFVERISSLCVETIGIGMAVNVELREKINLRKIPWKGGCIHSLKKIRTAFPLQYYKGFDLDFIKNTYEMECSFGLEKKSTILKSISKSLRLTHFGADYIRFPNFFESVGNLSLKSLELTDVRSKSFAFERISEIESLSDIYINGIVSGVDVSLSFIKNLKKVNKLHLMNIRGISDVDYLLDADQLKEVDIAYCKTDISEKLKDALMKKGVKVSVDQAHFPP